MKKIISFAVLIALACSCSKNNYVYICTGPTSECYHKKATCKGLENCSGGIYKVEKEEAVAEGRRPCGYCY